MELLAKLDNKGPFQFFWTLFCGDSRWDENFISFMHELAIKVIYESDKETGEIVTKLSLMEETLTLDEYLKDIRFCNDTRHTQIRKHVLTATRNFDNREKAFLKNIIMAKDNPMNTELFNYRIEFQARGAAHIHGVLWINFDGKLPNNVDNKLVKSAFHKFRYDDIMLQDEENEVIKFIDAFITCSSDATEVESLVIRECKNKRAHAQRAVSIAKTVNQHKHSRSCRKYGKTITCRFYYPKLPSRRTMIIKRPDVFYKDKLQELGTLKEHEKWLRERIRSYTKVLEHVKEAMIKYDNLDPNSTVLKQMENTSTYSIEKEILNVPGVKNLLLPNEDILARYEEALETSGSSAKTIILKRHPKDRYINNFNLEWIFAWNANMDLQLCLDFFQVISYITDYYSKDDSGTIEYLKKAKKRNSWPEYDSTIVTIGKPIFVTS